MRKYFGMKRLGKKWSWVRFAKMGKKRGINAEKRHWKGDFPQGTNLKRSHSAP
jgi:allantoicase